jgi:hypothetical protein
MKLNFHEQLTGRIYGFLTYLSVARRSIYVRGGIKLN